MAILGSPTVKVQFHHGPSTASFQSISDDLVLYHLAFPFGLTIPHASKADLSNHG